MKKIYCKDCKYYRDEFIYPVDGTTIKNCFNPIAFEHKDYPEERKSERINVVC
jgi:hypothetical protein